MSEQADQALNASQVARLLRKDRHTVARWTKAGLLPVWFVDDNDRPVYSLRTIQAHQQRAGELAAEQQRRAS